MKSRILKNMMFSFLVLMLSSGAPEANAQLNTGEPAPDFTLTDTEGQTHSLSQHQGKFVVLEWINDGCPFVQKHYNSGNMQQLQAALAEEGAVWYSVASSAEGKQGHHSPEEWNQYLADQESEAAALLLDPAGEVGKAYGAQTTPHMYLIDPQGNLVYQGAIDSKPSPDPADIPNSTNYVWQAYQEASSGQAVSEPSTKAYGCSVKY